LFFSTDQPVQIGIPEDPKIKTSEILRFLDKTFIHWKWMKREQTQNTLPAKKFVVIFKFRPLSVTFGFTFLIENRIMKS
jgi:hypothetical protein